jgi:predicted RNase H-like HicB family nuclease
MIQDYIRAALKRAAYKILPEDASYYGEIPGFQGVWANADSLEGCRAEIEEVLEDWILVKVASGEALPEIDGMCIHVKQAV